MFILSRFITAPFYPVYAATNTSQTLSLTQIAARHPPLITPVNT